MPPPDIATGAPDAPGGWGVPGADLPGEGPGAPVPIVGTPVPGPATATGTDEDILTGAYRAMQSAHPSPPGGVLLAQTVAIGPLRQTFLPLIPLRPGWEVLDLGTGFGPVAFELAHREPVRVTGVDRDPEVLAVTRGLTGPLGQWLQPGSSVELAEASADDLPFGGGTFDLAIAALLLQHVPDPAAVVAEMRRVLRPGGVVFAFDIDDGLGATYPDGGPLARLEGAFDAWQASYGGDRLIGRKLSVLFADAGFTVLRLHVLPQAQHLETRAGSELRIMTAARLRAARSGILGAGLLDGATFDALLAEYEAGPSHT
ncbi:MAG: methyltransferase domain-containing protein, partial [Acidimicrobiales bacterium]